MNEYGIMLQSILTAKIIEGRGLKSNGSAPIVVVMSIEGQTAATEPVSLKPGSDPVWKEVITFDV